MWLGFWPFRRARTAATFDFAGSAFAPTPIAPKQEDETQAAETILALALERYQYEHGRTKDIESQAGPRLGLSSAILVLAAGTLKEGPTCLAGGEQWFYHILIVSGLLVIFAALCFLIQTLRPAEFQEDPSLAHPVVFVHGEAILLHLLGHAALRCACPVAIVTNANIAVSGRDQADLPASTPRATMRRTL